MHVQKFPRFEDKVHPALRLRGNSTATAPPTGVSRYRRPPDLTPGQRFCFFSRKKIYILEASGSFQVGGKHFMA